MTTALANMVDSAPSTLNTLNELAAALGDDANFSTTVTNNIATKLPLAGGTLTGDLLVSVAAGNPSLTLKTAGAGNNPHINYRAGNSIVFDTMLVASAATDYWRVGYGASGSVTSEFLAVTSAGDVGIGTNSPTTFSGFLTVHQKNASGNAIHLVETAGGVISQTISTDGAGGRVLIGARSNHPTIFTQNDTERMRIDSSGRVGIGVSDPSTALDVNGVINVRTSGFQFGRITTNNTSASDGGLTFQTVSGGSFGEAMRIDGSGKVGIQNSSPSYLLEVGNATQTNSNIFSGRVNGDFIFNLSKANTNLFSIRNNAANTVHLNTQNSANLALGVSTATTTGTIESHLTINSSGNVGIGESSPQGKLHLKKTDTGNSPQNPAGNQLVIENGDSSGSADIQFLSASNGYNHLFFGDASDANVGVLLYDHTNNSMQFTTNTAERLRIDSNGKIFMTEGVPFSWADSSQNVAAEIYGDSSDNLIFRNTSAKTERMRIDSSGNLLVGTTSVISAGLINAEFLGGSKNGIDLKNTNTGNSGAFIGFFNSSGALAG